MHPPIRTLSTLPTFAVIGLVLGLLAGCDTPPTAPGGTPGLAAGSGAASMSQASFQLWRQGFNHGTDGWVTDDVPGPAGWCGDIETVARGSDPIQPSAGAAHAVVREGDCNAFHQGRGFLSSGPAAGFMPLNRSFPTGGYVQELDVYLDPTWPDGTAFGYVVSYQNLAYPIPLSFRYLELSVAKSGGALLVDGQEVDDAGWYTFRHRFHDDGGNLAVDFQLVRNGHVHAAASLSELPSLYFGEMPASLGVENTGSGYLWFSYISAGLDLAIDEQQLRRGR